ncbi:uncharacterized protein LOC128558139 [Mercenaria mercenaria]|uniref:uncharacterized protein LOC128558139 n=1 Tax=Mercenaria mercenaria TaxID=6596 RepID=UPI00234F1751|nr:uncharacterized protein LOC128558139 [Mercenaria mercenaria]
MASGGGINTDIPSDEAFERCERHKHHFIDMYCQNHDDVGCGTCIAENHRLCKDISYIPEFLRDNKSADSSEIQQILKLTAKSMTERHEGFKQEKQRVVKSRVKLLESVKKFRKEINDRLDELEKNTEEDIEEKYKTLINEVEERMQLFETSIAYISTTLNKLESTDNATQNFVIAKKAEKRVDKVAKVIEEIKVQTPSQNIDLTADPRISSLLEEINVLGTADIPKEDSRKYYVKVQSDKTECDIVSACTLDDGTILLSDNGNNRLKRLDSSIFTVRDYCDLPGQPWQVCAINKQQAAVCLPDKKEVRFISLTNRMNLTNNITTDFVCNGLAYADGNLYISDSNTSVYIYTVSGKLLEQFTKDQSGQNLFYDISSISVSVDGSRIYVADWKNGLIVLDNSGRVVRRFNDSHFGACDSYITGRGSLLMCGQSSNNVLQFEQNGELIGEVVRSDGRHFHPQAICCNQQMSKMVIGWNKDEIDVFDLI